ncbi:MAG: hypothetical protein LBP63_10130 [Prevotellaceae bacterium]|nr:hypothetical protein [Prevotellaceae bacterium]
MKKIYADRGNFCMAAKLQTFGKDLEYQTDSCIAMIQLVFSKITFNKINSI